MKHYNKAGIFVMILIALTLVNSLAVSAVGLGDAVSMFFTTGIGINALLISFVLFLFILLVLKDHLKDKKTEKTLIYIFIIIISIILAWNIGTEVLWRNSWFTLPVIINTMLLSLFFYLIFVITKARSKLSKKEAIGAFTIFIILISFLISTQYLSRQNYIWETNSFHDGKFYLFGETGCSKTVKGEEQLYCYTDSKGREGFGILRGMHLFVFIGAFFLFLWLFHQFVKDGLPKWARVILAIYIAAGIANDGTTKASFINMAYWVVLITIFWKLKDKGGNWQIQFGLYWAILEEVAERFGAGYWFIGGGFLTKIIIGIVFGYIAGAGFPALSKGVREAVKRSGGAAARDFLHYMGQIPGIRNIVNWIRATRPTVTPLGNLYPQLQNHIVNLNNRRRQLELSESLRNQMIEQFRSISERERTYIRRGTPVPPNLQNTINEFNWRIQLQERNIEIIRYRGGNIINAINQAIPAGAPPYPPPGPPIQPDPGGTEQNPHEGTNQDGSDDSLLGLQNRIQEELNNVHANNEQFYSVLESLNIQSNIPQNLRVP